MILKDYLYWLSTVDMESYGVAFSKNGHTRFSHQYLELSLDLNLPGT